jgi:nitrate reductase NapD
MSAYRCLINLAVERRPRVTTNAAGSVSGLCLMIRPGHLDDVESSLAALDWIEVHARDAATGRLIVVQEHQTIGEHQEGLRRLQAVPHVLSADLVVYHGLPFDEGAENRGAE